MSATPEKLPATTFASSSFIESEGEREGERERERERGVCLHRCIMYSLPANYARRVNYSTYPASHTRTRIPIFTRFK